MDRDMRAGWGTKAHAEATKDARTRNSAPDNVAKRERRSGRAELAWDPRVRERASTRRACGRSGDGDRRAGVRRCALDIAKVSKGVSKAVSVPRKFQEMQKAAHIRFP